MSGCLRIFRHSPALHRATYWLWLLMNYNMLIFVVGSTGS
jgi:hypothetical protein